MDRWLDGWMAVKLFKAVLVVYRFAGRVHPLYSNLSLPYFLHPYTPHRLIDMYLMWRKRTSTFRLSWCLCPFDDPPDTRRTVT